MAFLAHLSLNKEIDHNFSKAHRIVTTSILPLVEQYGEHSKSVWEASKVRVLRSSFILHYLPDETVPWCFSFMTLKRWLTNLETLPSPSLY